MHESIPNPNNINVRSTEREEIGVLDEKIDNLLEEFANSGLNTEEWVDEYIQLADSLDSLQEFYDKLLSFKEKRNDALISLEFAPGYTETEKEGFREFDSLTRSSFRRPDSFLGNGATAEVYSMSGNETFCVKFITDQERYNENNHMRREFDYLSRVHEHTKNGVVTTPYPIFLRIHAKEGHSYGMEKIKGASLSQITERPEQYEELITRAREVDREQVEADLLSFVKEMHATGVVHCDLFSRNLMIDINGRFYVIDFGKAKIMIDESDLEDQRKRDFVTAQQSLSEFFSAIDLLTN